MSIQAVSFGKQAITKKGNQYEKTNLGGKIGATVGAGYATYVGAKTVQALKKLNVDEFVIILKESLANMAEEAKEILPNIEIYAAKTIKKIKIASIPTIAIFAGLSILAGFGVGKIADAITNKVRRNKADSQNA